MTGARSSPQSSGNFGVKCRNRASGQTGPVCLMVDDTDFPKRGFQTELIGKVFSHVTHSMILGFKALFLGITDGRSQMLLDFSLVGEEGKKKNYGLKQRQLGASPSMTIFLLS